MAKIDGVQEISIDLLKPYQNNAKIHGAEQVEAIKRSIQEFGFISPCLIDKDYNLIAGHGRIMAAKELGMSEVPCLFIEGLTEAQRKAYILADNRLGELGAWDYSVVDLELDALRDMNFDISITGFDDIEPLEYQDGGGSMEYDHEPKKEEIECPRCGMRFVP